MTNTLSKIGLNDVADSDRRGRLVVARVYGRDAAGAGVEYVALLMRVPAGSNGREERSSTGQLADDGGDVADNGDWISIGEAVARAMRKTSV